MALCNLHGPNKFLLCDSWLSMYLSVFISLWFLFLLLSFKWASLSKDYFSRWLKIRVSTWITLVEQLSSAYPHLVSGINPWRKYQKMYLLSWNTSNYLRVLFLNPFSLLLILIHLLINFLKPFTCGLSIFFFKFTREEPESPWLRVAIEVSRALSLWEKKRSIILKDTQYSYRIFRPLQGLRLLLLQILHQVYNWMPHPVREWFVPSIKVMLPLLYQWAHLGSSL